MPVLDDLMMAILQLYPARRLRAAVTLRHAEHCTSALKRLVARFSWHADGFTDATSKDGFCAGGVCDARGIATIAITAILNPTVRACSIILFSASVAQMRCRSLP